MDDDIKPDDVNAWPGDLISKMSPVRHFEEDPPRIDNDAEWDNLIDDMVLQFGQYYKVRTNTDENAVDRVMSAYRIVLKAHKDPVGFDIRCNTVKVKAPRRPDRNDDTPVAVSGL